MLQLTSKKQLKAQRRRLAVIVAAIIVLGTLGNWAWDTFTGMNTARGVTHRQNVVWMAGGK